MKQTQQTRRQSRYGRTVRGWSWKTTEARLAAMEAARSADGVDRTEWLEAAIDEYLRKRKSVKKG